MLVSFSSRTLAPAHRVKNTSKWFADHDITVFDWPANMPDLNPRNIPGMGYSQEKDEKQSIRDSVSVESQADRFHVTPH